MSAVTGTLRLTRLAARRDRVRAPLWIGGLSALLAVQAAGNAETYAAEAERASAAAVLAANPALRMLRGAAADTSAGALLASDAFWILAILTALLSAVTVVRHTRQDEESGRGEMIAALPVGSHATLAAGLILGVSINVALAAALTVVLVLSDLPTAGSIALGASVGATGLVFAGVGAVTAQLSPSARTATSLAAVAVGAAYALRAIGDALGDSDAGAVTVTSAWPVWLSPIGWGQQVQAFADDRWWPLALSAVLFAGTVVVAAILSSRRDYGQGMLAQRPGPATAPAALLRPLGLAWRMQRAALACWAVAMIILGGLFGSVGQQIEDLRANDDFIDLLTKLGAAGADIADTYFAAAMTIIAAIIAAYPLQAVLRLHAEESDGRLEPILATALSRVRWLATHLAVTVISTLILLTLAGAAAGLLHGLLTGELRTELPRLTAAALAQLPAVLVLCGLAVTALGLLPRWATGATWAALAAALLLGPLGETLSLPSWLRDISPFTHVPAAPAADVTPAPVLLLTAVAIALTTIGTIAFNRRDLTQRG